MINKETIISAFDDKLTLMQWLKKVEEALNAGVVTSFESVSVDTTHVKFKITFADQTYVESNAIELPIGTKLYKHTLSNGNNSMVIISNMASKFDSNRDYKNYIISCNYLFYDGITYFVVAVKELYANRIELVLLNGATNQLYSFTLRNCIDNVTEL